MAGDEDLLDSSDYEAEQDTEDSEEELESAPKEKADARRLVENRLEELRLKKMMEDYDFDLD